MSSEIKYNEKFLFKKKLKSYFSTNDINKRRKKTISLNDIKDYSTKNIMKKENILGAELNFNPIFEKIFNNENKKNFNETLLSDLGEKEKNIEKMMLINNLNYFGIPFKLNFKKKLKINKNKLKYDRNFKLKKIKLGHMDYFNLETISKENLIKHQLNRKNEKILLNSKNFNSQKSSLPEELSVFSAKNILLSMNILKNNTKSRLFDFEKKYNARKSSLNTPINNKNNSVLKRNNSIFTSTKKNNFKTIDLCPNSFLKNSSSTRTVYKTKNKIYNLSRNSMRSDITKKNINSKTIYKNILNNIDIYNNKNFIYNFRTQENIQKDLSQEKLNTKTEINSENEIKIKNNKKKSDKNIKNLLFNNNNNYNKKDMIKIFKLSINDLNKYNNNYNKTNYLKKEYLDDCDYSEEELKKIKDKKMHTISHNFRKIKKKIKNVFNNYDTIVNKMPINERKKNKNLKNNKMLRFLVKNTIKNMATDLDICKNLINEKIVNSIDELSYKKDESKKEDIIKEIILEEKYKREHNISQNINTINKELSSFDSKYNNSSNNLFLKNKKLGNKIKSLKNNYIGKSGNNNLGYMKNDIDSNIYILEKLRKINEVELNKINNKLNEFQTKLQEEKNNNYIYYKNIFNNFFYILYILYIL